MYNRCVREEVEIDWWIEERKGKDQRVGALYAACQRCGSMGRLVMGTEDSENALQIITDEEKNRSQEITVSADIVQHTYTFLCPFSSGFLFGIFISQGSPLLLTHTHTHKHTLSELQSLLNFLPQVKR